MCIALAIGGAALVGGIASDVAANKQAGAAENAQNISQNEFRTITGQEQPYMNAGYGAVDALDWGLGTGGPAGTKTGAVGAGGLGYGSLTQPFTTDNWKSLSPAYNFQLQQGQQGVQNANAAGAGSLSGSALKDLTNYNQSAANTSFNNAFNQYQTQQGNIFSRLSGIATLGQNAASNTGAQGTALAGQAAQSAQNIGTAQAGGVVGAANAATGSISTALPWLAGGNTNATAPSANTTWTDQLPSGVGG